MNNWLTCKSYDENMRIDMCQSLFSINWIAHKNLPIIWKPFSTSSYLQLKTLLTICLGQNLKMLHAPSKLGQCKEEYYSINAIHSYCTITAALYIEDTECIKIWCAVTYQMPPWILTDVSLQWEEPYICNWCP